ncbi:MAG: chemotaxis protein CheD [Bacillota bacterium]
MSDAYAWMEGVNMQRTVDVGGCIVSNDIRDSLITYALGSCVAITIYSRERKILGMAHAVLPTSIINPDHSIIMPGYYVDTAFEKLKSYFLNEIMYNKGSLSIKLFGGSKSVFGDDFFNVGNKNLEAIKSILEAHGLKYDSRDTGSCISRTVEMFVADGRVKLTEYPLST